MLVEKTPIPDLLVVTPKRFGDARGFFAETWNKDVMADRGISLEFVQDNHSLSAEVGTLRGLHFQAPPRAQDKLVRCGQGSLFDVAVDIRKGSPTFGKWFGIELSAENGKQLLVPCGFAHGFVTRAPNTEICYKCSDTYAPDTEGAIRFDDPDLAIDWGVDPNSAILSDKDAAAPKLADIATPFEFEV
jgi:dTDP-4-dehydrorhamnose 3,5-epimerase